MLKASLKLPTSFKVLVCPWNKCTGYGCVKRGTFPRFPWHVSYVKVYCLQFNYPPTFPSLSDSAVSESFRLLPIVFCNYKINRDWIGFPDS